MRNFCIVFPISDPFFSYLFSPLLCKRNQRKNLASAESLTRAKDRFKYTEPATTSAEDQRVSHPQDLKKLSSQRKRHLAARRDVLFEAFFCYERNF
jgi:hypothetical protein